MHSLLLPDSVQGAATLATNAGSLLTSLLLLLLAFHQLVEIFVSHVVSLLLNLLLELVNLGDIVALFSVLCLHLEVFESLVELLVLRPLLLLLECLDLDLLLQEATLHIGHVDVRLEHLGEEVVGSRDRHLRLHQELHSFHDVGASCVIAVAKIEILVRWLLEDQENTLTRQLLS